MLRAHQLSTQEMDHEGLHVPSYLFQSVDFSSTPVLLTVCSLIAHLLQSSQFLQADK